MTPRSREAEEGHLGQRACAPSLCNGFSWLCVARQTPQTAPQTSGSLRHVSVRAFDTPSARYFGQVTESFGMCDSVVTLTAFRYSAILCVAGEAVHNPDRYALGPP